MYMVFRNVVYMRLNYPPPSSNLGLKENGTCKIRKPMNIWSLVGKSLCLHFLNLFQRCVCSCWLFCDKHVMRELLSIVKNYWCIELKKYFLSV